MPNRWFWAPFYSGVSVVVELALNRGGLLVWDYRWWNRCVIEALPIFLFGYLWFYAAAKYAIERKTLSQDIPVSLERRVTIAAWKGELEFGTTIEDTSGWMIDEVELWRRWGGPRRVFLFAGISDAEALRKKPGIPFFLIAGTKNTVILSNSEARP